MRTRKKTGGRTKGTPNRTTAETKALLQQIVNNEIENLSFLLDKLEPNERVNALSKLLPYIVPKQNEINANMITTNSELTPEQRTARIKELIEKAKKSI